MKPTDSKRVVTMRDISEVTGYSINTVSRALRNKSDISSETKAYIRKTTRSLGYINNTVAASLRLGHTKTVAMLVDDVSNAYHAMNIKIVEEYFAKHGYFLYIICTRDDEEIELQAIERAYSQRVAGILLSPAQHSHEPIELLRRFGTPFVLIGRCHDEADYAMWDDEKGGYLATKHLLTLGHRDILMLNTSSTVSNRFGRLEGYLKALREFGVPAREELIRSIRMIGNGSEQVADEMVSGSLSCTAVFAFSDLMGFNLWTNLRRRGKRVPEDYSIVGFDGICRRANLPFSMSSITCREDQPEAAYVAAERLFSKIGAEPTPSEPMRSVADVEFWDGGTTAPLR